MSAHARAAQIMEFETCVTMLAEPPVATNMAPLQNDLPNIGHRRI